MADPSLVERLATLNEVMRWNVTTAKLRRLENTPEGHRDCERMLDTARTILAEIMELERTTNGNAD